MHYSQSREEHFDIKKRKEYYIDNKDPRIKKVLDSWRGVRPTMHYSQSREEHFDIKKRKESSDRYKSSFKWKLQ
jgi:hypothetical protein